MPEARDWAIHRVLSVYFVANSRYPFPTTGLSLPSHTPERVPLLAQFATMTAVIVPFLGILSAPFLLWGWGFGWVDFGLLVGMYLLTALGVTVGFHLGSSPTGVSKRTPSSGSSWAYLGPWQSRIGTEMGRASPPAPSAQRHAGRSAFPPSRRSRTLGLSPRLLARSSWLGFQAQPCEPGPLCQRSSTAFIGAADQCSLSALDLPGFGNSRNPGRYPDRKLGRRPAWLCLGWLDAGVPGASCHLERQLGLSSVGPAALSGEGPEPEQLRARRPGDG